MATEIAPPKADSYEGLSGDDLLRVYRNMVTSRRIDDKEIQLKRQNRIFFQISGAGHEAVQTAIAFHMRKGSDWLFPYYRDRAICLGLGVTPRDMFLQAFGAADDPASKGRQMPSHWGAAALRIFTTSSPTSTECLPGVGAAEAGRYLLRKEVSGLAGAIARAAADEVVVITIGEGSTSEGEFWEALNSASTLKLPVVFVVEDNGYAISVPVEVQTPGGSISKLVRSYPASSSPRPTAAIFWPPTTRCDMRSPTRATGRGRLSSTRTSFAPTRTLSPTTRSSTGPRRSAGRTRIATRSRSLRPFSKKRGSPRPKISLRCVRRSMPKWAPQRSPPVRSPSPRPRPFTPTSIRRTWTPLRPPSTRRRRPPSPGSRRRWWTSSTPPSATRWPGTRASRSGARTWQTRAGPTSSASARARAASSR